MVPKRDWPKGDLAKMGMAKKECGQNGNGQKGMWPNWEWPFYRIANEIGQNKVSCRMVNSELNNFHRNL